MKERLKGFFIGVCSGAILIGSVSLAVQYSDTVQRFYNNIKITLNGTEIIPKDVNGNIVEPFTIDGTTYLPVRAISNALGLNVDWNWETNTVILSEEKEIIQPSNKENNVDSKEEIITSLKRSNKISLLKHEDNYYILDSRGVLGLIDFIWYKDDLIFVSNDLPLEISFLILLAECDTIETVKNTDNPYFDKKVVFENLKCNGKKIEDLLLYGNDETVWYSPSHKYEPVWFEYNGIKIYNRDIQNEFEVKNGIRYFENKICVNDVFDILGIDKKISFGEYEGLTYIEIK